MISFQLALQFFRRLPFRAFRLGKGSERVFVLDDLACFRDDSTAGFVLGFLGKSMTDQVNVKRRRISWPY